ncbi:MAG: hypothetical protein MUO26_01165 [Methanotrichaceae archaeon]|nr:hypothetical protein [Methanotrichaceae archaeon]
MSSWISKAIDHCEKVNEVVLKDVETPKIEMVKLRTPSMGKKSIQDCEYDNEGTWIWLSMATECKLVISHVIGER